MAPRERGTPMKTNNRRATWAILGVLVAVLLVLKLLGGSSGTRPESAAVAAPLREPRVAAPAPARVQPAEKTPVAGPLPATSPLAVAAPADEETASGVPVTEAMPAGLAQLALEHGPEGVAGLPEQRQRAGTNAARERRNRRDGPLPSGPSGPSGKRKPGRAPRDGGTEKIFGKGGELRAGEGRNPGGKRQGDGKAKTDGKPEGDGQPADSRGRG